MTATPDEPAIADGTYPVFILDAEEHTDEATSTVKLSVTILSGVHKGEVLDLVAANLGMSDIDLIGMPGTLTVRDRTPTLRIDDV